MEQIVAVAVELESGESRYFLTWGRLQDPVETGPLCDLVLRHAPRFSLGGTAVRARVCYSLQEAAMSRNAPYFFECLLSLNLHAVPSHRQLYKQWRRDKLDALERGAEIAYCGNPEQRRLYEQHHSLGENGPSPVES